MTLSFDDLMNGIANESDVGDYIFERIACSVITDEPTGSMTLTENCTPVLIGCHGKDYPVIVIDDADIILRDGDTNFSVNWEEIDY